MLFRSELAAVPGVAAVRGRGFLIGIDLDADIAPGVVAAGREGGFLLNATGPRTLRLAPPLILSAEEAHSFTRALPALIEAASPKEAR